MVTQTKIEPFRMENNMDWECVKYIDIENI
jgi:hypothetical protein